MDNHPQNLIRKDVDSLAVRPHLFDYKKVYSGFSWEQVRHELDGLPEDRGLNIAHEAVDGHTGGEGGRYVALRWLGKNDTVIDFTYGDLKKYSNRFANVLRMLGVGKGERVFSLSGRIPELYFAALGTLKNISVFCPLFSAFGPEPIAQRLERGDARVLVTTERLYRKKVADLRKRLPQLQHIRLADTSVDLESDVLSLPKLMAEASTDFTIPPTDPEDMALLHFTSGTTGQPKGAVHVHNAVLTHYLTGE